MNFKKDTSGTLYRKDPQYTDKYGTPGVALNSTDAIVDLEAIHFVNIEETTQFLVRCVERTKDGKAILPILEDLGLDFEFLEAYGLLFPVYNVTKVDNHDRIFEIMIEFDPDLIGQRTINRAPLTGIHIGHNEIKLERDVDYQMPNPFCLRGSNTKGEKLLPLTVTQNPMILRLDSAKVQLEKEERVQVISNWNPAAIQYK